MEKDYMERWICRRRRRHLYVRPKAKQHQHLLMQRRRKKMMRYDLKMVISRCWMRTWHLPHFMVM